MYRTLVYEFSFMASIKTFMHFKTKIDTHRCGKFKPQVNEHEFQRKKSNFCHGKLTDLLRALLFLITTYFSLI